MTLSLSTLCEVICAFHLASYVKGPIADRGGLMIVAPPGNLKSTSLLLLEKHYANAVTFSNLNTKTLTRLRGDLMAGTVRTLILPDLQSIYAGDPRTADRLEAAIMQMVSEGHIGASWEDSRHRKFSTRCAVFAAMPNAFFERRAPIWEDNGFLRRFLWVFYRFKNPYLLTESLVKWQRARVNGKLVVPQVPMDEIEDTATEVERRELLSMLKYQPGPHETQLVLWARALSALRWHYKRIGDPRNAMDTMREFSGSLQSEAVELTLGTPASNGGKPK
jgi:hypothetical protein